MSDNKKTQTISWRNFFRFIPKAKLSWVLIIISVLASLFYSQISSLLPDATGAVYAGDFSKESLIRLILYTCGTYGALSLSSVLQSIAVCYSNRNLRNAAWKKMMHTNASETTSRSADKLLSAITTDSGIVTTSIVVFLANFPSAIYFIIVSIFEAKETNIKLVWLMFAMVPIYILYGILVGRWEEKVDNRIRIRVGALTGFLSERLHNLDVIKAYTTEDKERAEGAAVTEKLYKANLGTSYVSSVVMGYSTICDVAATLIAVFGAAVLLKQGEITVIEWMSYFVLMPMVNSRLRTLVDQWVSVKAIRGYSTRLCSIMNAEAEDDSGIEASISGDISINDVSFSYDDKRVLNNITVTIPKDKVTVIVGPSGSGKTTLLNLLERIYKPDEGSITINNTDISDIKLSCYRSQIAYIQQDAGMFSGTVREAICYGIHRTVSDSELSDVTRRVGILNDIEMLPDKFDSQIAFWGTSLSGGQKQKMVIARELLRNSRLVLLDEPTSALDAATAADIYSGLKSLFVGKTLVTVTHDLHLAGTADQIIVMEQGCIVGCGTHDHLMESCKLYQMLVQEESYQEVYGA